MQHSEEYYQNAERAAYIGEGMEKHIKEGGEIFLNEEDRLFLKNKIEHQGLGRDLSVIRGGANLSQQAEDLVKVFSVQSLRNQGCDGLSGIVTNTVLGLLENKSGNVFGGDGDKVIEEEEMGKVGQFIEDFFGGFYEKEFKFVPTQYEEGSWERKTMYRVEAVLAVTNKLLWILAADDEEEGKRRQNTPGVLKHIRERVLRGLEREGEVIPEGIARVEKGEIVRHLPKGGLGFILDTLGQM